MKLRVFIPIMIVINSVAVLWGLYLAFWPMKTIEIQREDQILNPGKRVKPGEALIYQIHYCKYTNKQAAVNRYLQGDSVTYPLPPAVNNIPAGCRIAVVRNAIIPPGITPGTYRLQLSATYQLNPLRSETVTHQSEEFEVTP